MTRTFEGNFMKGCHLKGVIYGSNISFENASLVQMFPTGEHKTALKFFDIIDDNIFNMTFYSSISN